MTPVAVTLRELGVGDGPVLDAVFAGLSETSRFHRFHGPVPRLTGTMRAKLGAVDGHRHIAVAAFAGCRPVGIARLVQLRDGPVELAVEVVDAWHGRGVGTRLARAVVERGVAAGHTCVVAEVMAENQAMLALLRRLFPDARTSRVGTEITCVCVLGGGSVPTPSAA